LESCRAPTLLAELEDDDELPEPDEDENDDDENEDDDDYEEVMVSRTLLALMVGVIVIMSPLLLSFDFVRRRKATKQLSEDQRLEARGGVGTMSLC